MMGTIYILTAGTQDGLLSDEICKIGWSAGDFSRRKYDVSTSCPFELELYHWFPATKADEARLHKALSKWRIRREWFWFNAEVEDYLDAYELELSLERRPA